MKQLFFPLFAIALLLGCKAENVAGRMDRTKLNIGTYFLHPYARTPQHVKDLADCGIDFVIGVNNDKQLLDMFLECGVGAVVSGEAPSWWGGDGHNSGKLAQTHPLSEYEKYAASYVDHPAIWGIDIGDEPSALDFPHYGKVFAKVAQLHPNTFPYLNLYPNYASVASNTGEQTVNQLGTETYAQHICEYCKNVPSDYICYDFYVYSIDTPRMFENLRVISDACTSSGRSMWIVLQVNSQKKEKWISTNELRYQAYTSLAFGAEVITWACYTAGWWENQVLDEKGEKTVQYEKLKEVNAELHALGPKYMKYRRLNTSFVGFGNTQWLGKANTASVEKYSDSFICDLKADDNGPLVVGTFESRDAKGRKAIFVCAADDPYDEHHTTRELTIRTLNNKKISVTGPDGNTVQLRSVIGEYHIPIESSSALLIEE